MRVIAQGKEFDIVEYSPATRTVGGVYDEDSTMNFTKKYTKKSFKFPYVVFLRQRFGFEVHCDWFSYFSCLYLKEPFKTFQTSLATPAFIAYNKDKNSFLHRMTDDAGGLCLYFGVFPTPSQASRKPMKELISQFWCTPVKLYGSGQKLPCDLGNDLSQMMEHRILKPIESFTKIFSPTSLKELRNL